MEIALSTCWNSHRHTDGRAMLEEIREAGFQVVELSHGVRVSLAPGVLDAVAEGIVRVGSVHNFCPLPPGVLGASPNLYEPTAWFRSEQKAWVRQTRRTIDFAAQVSAKVVVLHGGRIRTVWGNPEKAMRRARWISLDRGKPLQDRVHAKQVFRQLRRMERFSGIARVRLLACLRAILPYAESKEIQLALENREGVLEYPLDSHFAGIFDELGAPDTLGYWHDTGHAQRKALLGITQPRKLLLQNQKRLLGMHLHDVSLDERDHLIPGRGIVDWDLVRTHLEPHHHTVLELSPAVTTDDLRAGHEYLRQRLHP